MNEVQRGREREREVLEAARSADDWASETPSQQRRLGTGRKKKKKTTQKKRQEKENGPESEFDS